MSTPPSPHGSLTFLAAIHEIAGKVPTCRGEQRVNPEDSLIRGCNSERSEASVPGQVLLSIPIATARTRKAFAVGGSLFLPFFLASCHSSERLTTNTTACRLATLQSPLTCWGKTMTSRRRRLLCHIPRPSSDTNPGMQVKFASRIPRTLASFRR